MEVTEFNKSNYSNQELANMVNEMAFGRKKRPKKKKVYVRTGQDPVNPRVKTEIVKSPPKTAKKISETDHFKRYSMMGGKEIVVPKKNVILKKLNQRRKRNAKTYK